MTGPIALGPASRFGTAIKRIGVVKEMQRRFPSPGPSARILWIGITSPCR